MNLFDAIKQVRNTQDAWLTNPERTIPGQKMGYQVTEATDRADLIAYLRKVSPP